MNPRYQAFRTASHVCSATRAPERERGCGHHDLTPILLASWGGAIWCRFPPFSGSVAVAVGAPRPAFCNTMWGERLSSEESRQEDEVNLLFFFGGSRSPRRKVSQGQKKKKSEMEMEMVLLVPWELLACERLEWGARGG